MTRAPSQACSGAARARSCAKHAGFGLIYCVSQQFLDGFGWCRAHGWRCDVRAFIGAQRRSARAFLGLMRNSQLFEVFVRERLLLASQGYPVTCAFEAKARAL